MTAAKRATQRRIGPPRIWAVDVRSALGVVGTLAKYLSLASLAGAAVAIGYGESFWPFLAAGAIVAAAGLALERVAHVPGRLGAREGFLVVALTWLVAAAFGALPYLLSGDPQYTRPVDAYFESMSGFTTTGASVLTDIGDVDRSLLLWRSLTQWLGGMGIIVLALAVLPRLRVGGRQLLEHEMPGPEIEALTSRIRDTARQLWVLYVALTALQVLILASFGWTGLDERMDLYSAVTHAFATLPTGGFSSDPRSLELFSAATQWVVAGFMLLAGVNFAVTYRALVRREPKIFARDEELRLYLGIAALGSLVLIVQLWSEGIAVGEAAVRHGVFQTVSMMTTTGFASLDFATWPALALMALVGLMFVGGSAGSTSGSIKVVRHLLLGKILRRELDQTVHPEVVIPVRLNRRVVDERTLRAITGFILLYVGLFVAGASLLAIDAARTGLDLSALDAIAAAATALSNTGPGLGFAGPMGSFEPFSDLSILVMTGLMWLGRLELIPILVLLTRHYWRV